MKQQELDDFIAHHQRVRLHDSVWRSDPVHAKTRPDPVLAKTPSEGGTGSGTSKGPAQP
jgi:hypothetical protein